MNPVLEITIPPPDNFYNLYADGDCIRKEYNKKTDITTLYYKEGSAVFLYYTYPTHRRVYLIRNRDSVCSKSLPGLSGKVFILFKQYASRVDKTKKAVSYLKTHTNGAYSFPDLFYLRLDCILKKREGINYMELAALCAGNAEREYYPEKT
jgi:hypothetical protein